MEEGPEPVPEAPRALLSEPGAVGKPGGEGRREY